MTATSRAGVTRVVAPLVAAEHVVVHDVRPVLERGDAEEGEQRHLQRACGTNGRLGTAVFRAARRS